jgi:radical SAM protein with 4Fe4S-binding SPASM domain
MSALLAQVNQRALGLGIPLSVHLDLTWRCNERCIHCYLDHESPDELGTGEIRDLLDQMAEAGVFVLTLSGGEIFLRKDIFQILEHASSLRFNVKLKTNGIMIGEAEAARIRESGVQNVQISLYSHRPEVHDAITKIRGSHGRTIQAIRFLRSQRIPVVVACVLMRANFGDQAEVQLLAAELDAQFTIDPTITPHFTGDRSLLELGLQREQLSEVFHTSSLVGDVDAFCSISPVEEDVLDAIPCSAGHTACYISPNGTLYPCVQFPLPCGNVRTQRFQEIWAGSPQLLEVRSIRARHLTVCSSCRHAGGCTRCPGLAYMEGDMRGPSTADCEKSYVRTGVPSANMMRMNAAVASTQSLVRINGV